MALIKHLPCVALVLRTNEKTQRELLQGVLDYSKRHGPWAIRIFNTSGELTAEGDIRRFSGGIGSFGDARLVNRFRAHGIPLIVECDVPKKRTLNIPDVIRVFCDNAPIGRAAADYFLERHFTHFAYVGDLLRSTWGMRRRMAFVERLAEAGFTCSVHHGAKPDLASWLATLPRPCCLFAANDERARHVLDTCLSVGLAVPQDISVLSCDNDEIICETTTPPLSSIQFDTMQTGFRIAAELDRLMHGCPSSAPAFTYTISNIVTRYSSEVVHVADPLVERALSYIRFNAAAPLPVDLLVAELHVSRRHLEQRFRLVTGRSIHAEIVRTRLARAQTLLRTSQMGVDEIAAHCAFPSASHLCAVFRRHFGVTPSAFRRGDAPCEIAWPHSSGRR